METARERPGAGCKMTRLTSRFVLLIATAAVAPLVLYGLISVTYLRSGTQDSVTNGNLQVAGQVSERIRLYFDNNVRVLRSVGMELLDTHLARWQQERILRNHVLDFPEFREVTLFDPGGRLLVSSRLGRTRIALPEPGSVSKSGVYIAPLELDNDSLPTTIICVRLNPTSEGAGWLVAEISLEELWRMVDRIRVGDEGYAFLLGEDGSFIAAGNPDKKRLIAAAATGNEPERVVAEQLRKLPADSADAHKDYIDSTGRKMLAVAAHVGTPSWTVIVEQPTREAFAITRVLERQLLVAIALALLGTVVVGWFWGRSFITRISALMRATRAIAEGRMDERVSIGGRDEIRQLGDSFNSMADRLVELQDDVRKQERQAMFGRIAAGLVHDLSHPIQNIGNSCKLILKMFDDDEYRDTFKRTVDREMVIIKRVLDDLRNIARPIPLERFPVDINRSVAEVVESMQQASDTAGVTLRAELAPEVGFIEGDLFALGRVYRNLIINAIQATAPGGLVAIQTETLEKRVQIRVYDTGCGIPPDRLGAIFEDFHTTKRRGLGLGLAISKKIVEQLGGEIHVTSEVGKGTTFVLDFPRTQPRPMAVAAG
jgi:signal transduction histidine kinase